MIAAVIILATLSGFANVYLCLLVYGLSQRLREEIEARQCWDNGDAS